jgi:YidC/Oxa1 family membrane protein insertase
MNEEVMKLYKEHSINPLSGCLPLLIQIPILIALFTSLRNSIELRGEPFLWLPDLSGADPLFIMPVLIVITMHYQQKQMNVDPNQAAAMKFMPIFMFFICLTLPSGVLVYWIVSNILQIMQQAYDPKDATKPVLAATTGNSDTSILTTATDVTTKTTDKKSDKSSGKKKKNQR